MTGRAKNTRNRIASIAIAASAFMAGQAAATAGAGLLFSPDDTATRAEVVTMIYRAFGSPPVTGENPFVDVPPDAYYDAAVTWAWQNGVTTGTGTATADPIPAMKWAVNVEQTVVDAATEFNVDLEVMVRIIQCESGGNPAAKNPTSTASGLGQFLDSTWNANAPRLGYAATRAESFRVTPAARVMALVLSEQGTRPWNASKRCWSRA